MNYGLENKIVLVTGGSRGLGRTMIDEFKKQGCTVVFGNRDEVLGEKVARETGCEYVRFDLRDKASIVHLMEHMVEKYGRLDILVNNAAITSSHQAPIDLLEPDYVNDAFTANSLGTFVCIQEAVKIMKEQESRGCIVNITSATSVRGGAGLAAYAASKAAINSMTASAANEYAKTGVRINAVMSGVIGTEATKAFKEASPEHYAMFCDGIPAKRVAEPEEICKPVLWLCCDDASYVNGICLSCDGGLNT